ARVGKYSRGRGDGRLVDEYDMGEITLNTVVQVPSEGMVEIGVTLCFQKVDAAIDEFGHRNFLRSGLTKLAKTLRKVKSEYRIEAEAKVEGTALNPFDKKEIKLHD